MFHPGPGPVPILFSVLSGVVSVIAAALVFLLVLGVLFLLVRFLWFGTRAAQVYLVKNGEPGRFTWPPRPVGEPPVAPSPATASGTQSAAPAAAPSTESPATDETVPLPDNAAPVPPRAPLKPKSPPAG